MKRTLGVLFIISISLLSWNPENTTKTAKKGTHCAPQWESLANLLKKPEQIQNAKYFNTRKWLDFFKQTGTLFTDPVYEHYERFSVWATPVIPLSMNLQNNPKNISKTDINLQNLVIMTKIFAIQQNVFLFMPLYRENQKQIRKSC